MHVDIRINREPMMNDTEFASIDFDALAGALRIAALAWIDAQAVLRARLPIVEVQQ